MIWCEYMNEQQEKDPVKFHFIPEIAEIIAHAANTWAWLEMELHRTLWELAELSPLLGVCLTGQIFTFGAKIDCLVSLLRARDFPDGMIKKVTKFAESARPALDARNRFVHDVWLIDHWNPSQMGKLRITSNKRAEHRIDPVTADTLREDLNKIIKIQAQFTPIRHEISKLLPQLPRRFETANDPMTEIR